MEVWACFPTIGKSIVMPLIGILLLKEIFPLLEAAVLGILFMSCLRLLVFSSVVGKGTICKALVVGWWGR